MACPPASSRAVDIRIQLRRHVTMAVQWRRSCQDVMVTVLSGTHVKDDRDCMSAGVEAGFRNIKTPSAWCSASAPYAAPLMSAGSCF